MAEKQSVTRPVDLERHFSRRNPIVEGLLQTGGKVVSPVYDFSSYLLNQAGLKTPSFEEYTGIKPFGFGPGMSGESTFFTPPKTNYPPETQIIPAIPGRPGTEVGAGMPLPPLKQKMDQANATGTPSVMPYIAAGTDQGQNARERSFLERMSQSGLLSTLQGMARAERQYGVGPLAAFSESNLDVQAARSAAEQKAAKRQSEASDRKAKILAEQIKKSGPAKLTATIDKRLTSFRSNSEALNTINRYLTILTSGQTGGIAGKMEKGIDDLASLVGLGSGSQASKSEAARSLLLSTISSLKQTEGQISKYDYEEIENYLKKPNSWWINNEKIENQLRNLRPVIERTLSQDAMIIRESGRDPSQFSGYNNIRLSTPGRTVTE